MTTSLLLCTALAFAAPVELSLEQALIRAADHDVRRGASALGAQRAGHDAHRATARLLPRLNLGFTLTRNAKAIEVNDRVVSFLIQPQGTVSGRLSLFRGTDIPNALAAWTEEDAARADMAALNLDLAHDVSASFLDAAEAKALADTQRASLAWADELVRVAEVRAANAAGLQLDVEVARAEKLRTAAAVARADGALAGAMSGLALRLGYPADQQLEARCEVGCVSAPPEPEPRPSMRALRLQADAAQTRAWGTWLLFLPELELVGNVRISQPTLFNPDPLWWNAQLVASWTIFNGTGDLAELFASQTERRRADLATEILRRQHEEARVRADNGLNAAEAVARAEQARAEAMARALTYVEARYKQGLERALDVAEAARERSLAEQAAVGARFALERARLDAWRARGQAPFSNGSESNDER